MDFPRQQQTPSWWRSRPSARAAVYALLYSAITIAVADPLATMLYESIRESLGLPYSSTSMAQLLPQQSLFVYLYFLVFAYVAETTVERR